MGKIKWFGLGIFGLLIIYFMYKVDKVDKDTCKTQKKLNDAWKQIQEGEKIIHEKMKNGRNEVTTSIGKMRYKDKDGNIHEFDVKDFEQFCKVMSDKSNTLMFS